MSPEKQVIHIVDDDEAVRQSLEFLLKSARFAVQAYDSASAFLESIDGFSPGCVITDVRMPGMTGIELLKKLKTVSQTIPVIIMTGHGDVRLAVEAMKYGALDFLEKPFDDEILLKAVNAAFERLERENRRETDRAEILDKLAALSNRERQVLEGLVAGLPNKSIAFDLKISPRTVEIYRANVMTKMAASSLSDLVRMALLAGILESHDSA